MVFSLNPVLLLNFFIPASKGVYKRIFLAYIVYNNKVVIYKYFSPTGLAARKLLSGYKVF